jgi:hypothetical protein
MAGVDVGPGAVLGGERYTLERRLGAGGMASVWLAADEVLGRPVAVKVMADTLAFDELYRERFAREARAAASVSHPAIVPVYDYGLHGGRPYLVMEYVSGGNLADVVAGRRSPIPDPGRLARELLGALDCVHAAGLVHRDVKPANILLDSNGRARLTDFGIAQPQDATSLTATGMVIGSIRYLAPEVAAGARATASADLYAAGVVLGELTAADRSVGLSDLIAALTAASADRRPGSAAAALELLEGSTGQAPSATAPTRVVPVARDAAPGAGGPGPGAERPGRGAGRLGRGSGRPGSGTTRTRRVERPAAGSPDRGRRSAVAVAGRPRAVVAAVAVVLVLVVVLVIANAGGGGGSPAAKAARTTVAPASASAPLADQVSSLEKIVGRAAKP